MKVGISSQNFRSVTGHAGKTRRFLVYRLQSDQEPVELNRIELPKEMSMHEWNGESRHPLFELDHLITGGCGEGFIRKMGSQGVTVHITDEQKPLKALKQLLDSLQTRTLEQADC